MDEFHYADRDRGVAWQVPLLTMPHARFLLMSATLGGTRFFEPSHLNGRPTVTVKSSDRPVSVRLSKSRWRIRSRSWWTSKTPAYVVHFTQADAATSAQDFTSLKISTRSRKPDRGAYRGRRVQQPMRRRHPQMAQARHRPATRDCFQCRVLVKARAGGPVEGDLRHGHARRGHQRAHPHRSVPRLQVRWTETAHLSAATSIDRRTRRAQGFDDRGFVVVRAPDTSSNLRLNERRRATARRS